MDVQSNFTLTPSLGVMAVDDTFLRLRAVHEANQLVADHNAFGDAVMIGRLADLVERARFPDAEKLRLMTATELRARADIIRSLAMSGLPSPKC